MMKIGRDLLVGAAALLAALPAFAIDGGFAAPGGGDTYYEKAVEEGAAATSSSLLATEDGAASGGLPTSLYVVDAQGGVAYRNLGNGAWQLELTMVRRPHERVDAVYDLVLALPLPVGSSSDAWRIAPKVGLSASSAPVLYGGEQVVLKRNVPLEKTWLPLLAGAPGGLPDLSRTGYAWTLWDTIVRYDASAGVTLQAFATFDYTADPRVAAPDSENPDNAAYVITWIPTLEAVPPFAIRLDVVERHKE